MSYTEIFIFDKEGDAYNTADIKNSWRGAMSIWRILEKKYLKPLEKPDWMAHEDYEKSGYSRTSIPYFDDSKPNPMRPIWDLWNDAKVNRIDKIVLGTTFDKVVVMHDDIPETIEAFKNFEGETSLKEQADVLQEIFDDSEAIAVAWNQTSVVGGTWKNYDEEKEEETPYNILKQDMHWNLFEELNQMKTD